MARAAGSRAASAKPADTNGARVNGNGTSQQSTALKAPLKDKGPARRVAKKASEGPVADGASSADSEMEDAPEAAPAKRKINAFQKPRAPAYTRKVTARGRAKKTATPAPEPKPAPSKSTKRKKDQSSEPEPEVDAEPAAKKTKVAKTNGTKSAAKPAPKQSKKVEASEPESESEPEAEANDKSASKATKVEKPKAAPAKVTKAPAKSLARGPRRLKGKKNEINELRHTVPLKVFVFGEGSSGELGLGASKKSIDVKRPRYNEALSNQQVVRVAAGGMHVVALTKDNRILTWGVNDNGALGRDTSNADVKLRDMDADDSDSDDDETGGLNDLESTPTAVSAEYFPEDTTFVDVAAGDSCSFALTTEGAVYGWGTFRKNDGILGFERGNHTAKFPVFIDTVTKVKQIVCGTNHVYALDKDGKVYAWGNGQQNQLGRRVNERILSEALLPNRVGFHDGNFKRPSQKIKYLASGDYHGMAIAEDGHVWAWGANNYCESGFTENAGAEDANVPAPRIIASLEGKNVVQLAGGSHHNIAITKDGEVLTWGRCDGSQTGIPSAQLEAEQDEAKVMRNNGRPKILIEPTPIPNLSNVVTGACGPDHTIVIDKNGKAWSWGFSANYQTGLGDTDDVDIPTMIDNTATREMKLTWAGCGGQYSIVASEKE